MSEHNETFMYYYYLFNYSDLVLYEDSIEHDQFSSKIHKHSAILGTVLSIASLLLNVFVITILIRDARLKSDIYYLQIVNCSVANVLIGGFVIPLTVYSILYPWALGNFMCKFWILSDVFLPFVSLLTLVFLNLDRLMLLTRAELYSCLFQLCLKPILLISPWLIAFVLVVPIWTHGSLPYELRPGECIIMMSKYVAFTGCIITYYLPCVCLIFFALAIVMVRLGRRGVPLSINQREQSLNTLVVPSDTVIEGYSETKISKRGSHHKRPKTVSTHSIVAVFLASFLFCSMWFPYHCMNILIYFCTSHLCMPSPILSQVVTWASTASSSVVPIAWLVDKKARHSCEHLCCGEFKRISVEEEDDV